MEWLLVPIIVSVGFSSFILGYNAGTQHGHTKATNNIMKYIAETMPNLWAAYKKGVTEGYEQGLADANAGADNESA